MIGSIEMYATYSWIVEPDSNAGQRGRKQRCGISLLEVLVAISIMATASYAAMASLGPASMQSAGAREAVDELASLLRSARQSAIAKQVPVELRFAGTSNGRWVEQMTDGPATISPSPIIVPMVLPTGVAVRGWPGSVRFDASGAANRSLDLMIGYPGHEYRVRLYQASGVIRVNRP